MESIEIRKGLEIGVEELIDGVSKVDTPVLEKIMNTLNHILINRKGQDSAEREKELLEKMETLVPVFVKDRYQQLHAKAQTENISEAEHEELRQIVAFIEEKATERLYLMAEMAALRQISLKELVEQLRRQRYGYA